jgi:hypothetical protein
MIGEDISECMYDWFYSDHGTSSATVGSVIDATSIADGPVREIMDAILKEPLFLGSFHDTGIEIWLDALREERDDMDMHIT